MLRFFFFILSICLSVIPTFAETGSIIPIEPPSCDTVYAINGPEQVKVGSSHEYYLTTGSGTDSSGSITFVLKRDRKVIETIKDREKYLRYFTTPGEALLEARITITENPCEGIITKKIRVYDSVITYIGSEKIGVETGMKDIFEKNNILYKSYIDTLNISTSEDSQDIWNSIDQSDIFIIGTSDILGFFSDIVKLQKTK